MEEQETGRNDKPETEVKLESNLIVLPGYGTEYEDPNSRHYYKDGVQRARLFEHDFEEAKIPRRMWNYAPCDVPKQLRDKLRPWLDQWKPRQWATEGVLISAPNEELGEVLFGALILEVMRRCNTGYMMSAHDVYPYFVCNAYGPSYTLLEQVCENRILGIYNFGTEDRKFGDAVMAQLLNKRFDLQKPTVVLTNKSRDWISQKYPESILQPLLRAMICVEVK